MDSGSSKISEKNVTQKKWYAWCYMAHPKLYISLSFESALNKIAPESWALSQLSARKSGQLGPWAQFSWDQN